MAELFSKIGLESGNLGETWQQCWGVEEGVFMGRAEGLCSKLLNCKLGKFTSASFTLGSNEELVGCRTFKEFDGFR